MTSEPDSPFVWAKIRALVVEDDPSARSLYVLALRRMPEWAEIEIVEAGTVLGAEMALKVGPRFDVILLDLHLPNGQGLDVIYRLSRAQAFPPAMVVLTGINFDIAHQVRGIREGACTWINKGDLVKPGGYLDWTVLERAVTYSLARRDWLGPMLIERSRRIASEGVSSG